MWWFSETSLIDGHIQREGQTRLREASCVLRVRVMVVHEKRVLIVSLETARNSPWVQPLTSTLFSLTQHLTFRAGGKGKQQSSATLSPLKLVGALTVRSKPLLHYPFYCSAFVDSVRGVNSMTLVSFVAERCVVTVCVWTPTVCEPFQHNNAMSVTPVDFTPYVRHTAEQCAERPTWLLQWSMLPIILSCCLQRILWLSGILSRILKCLCLTIKSSLRQLVLWIGVHSQRVTNYVF